MHRFKLAPALLAALWLFACAPAADESGTDARVVPREATPATLGDLPANFGGILPCADCPGIEYRLDLLPDSAYYLRQTYLERERTVDAIGHYAFDTSSSTLTLWTAVLEPTSFRLIDTDTLRLLDRNGDDIESALNYKLERLPEFSPSDLSLPLRGIYNYRADAGSFVECESGRRFVVAQEADNAALESAYLAARRSNSDSLLVSFDGRITTRAPVEGPGMQPTVVVDRFTGVWPSESCGARGSVSELLDNNWVLTRIGEDPVILTEAAREARLVLGSADNRVTGFGGCNNFTGNYELSGNSLRFGELVANLRACIEGGELESRLFAALGDTTRFERNRHHLDFFDDEGDRIARFEAREL